ncbi:ParB/RepB/Spo0J family partition protein [Craterilacuibacter sinensis]|uniref:ParB/RepB/Spo0J family partition protein n=1 Tax=Craterilacuibacter sinensis TaxID=2686017 RepID=A0A845BNN4_9NEIS|nr:ParB/RepB/Spo0J family partition protein [Craterilacuibacter sinensis]MXR37899.1 ParB/RepB/Spo0J family partition protein [Craterilacuibacter sinensis]RQW25873.1 ParB/RepB/Spo0J family partition protein [Rhodobacteraceae bacterium CH30]
MAKLKGLGRGLDALLAVTDPADDRLQTLAVSSIRPGRYQPRSHMNEAALEELAASIRAQGIIQPVVVREIGLGEYELIAGERRWRASQKAGLTEIPAVIRSVADEAALAMALIENIQRQELDPIEEAQGIARLIKEFELTHDAAAAAVGRSRSAVSNLLRLLSLPEPVQLLLHQGQIEMGHARALLALPALQQLELANQVVLHGWSVREVERRVQALAGAAVHAPVAAKPRDADVARLCEELSEVLGAKVAIRTAKGGRGKMTIEYATLDELDGIIGRLQIR